MSKHQRITTLRSPATRWLLKITSTLLVLVVIAACGDTGGGGNTGTTGGTATVGGTGATSAPGTTDTAGTETPEAGTTPDATAGITGTGDTEATTEPTDTTGGGTEGGETTTEVTLPVSHVLDNVQLYDGQTISVTGVVSDVVDTRAFTLTDSTTGGEATGGTGTTGTDQGLLVLVAAGATEGATEGGATGTTGGGAGGATTGEGCDAAEIGGRLSGTGGGTTGGTTGGVTDTLTGTGAITVDATLIDTNLEIVGTLCIFDDDQVTELLDTDVDPGLIAGLANRPVLFAWSLRETEETER